MENHTTYKTNDIILAATLKVSGYQLESIDVKGRQGTFNFLDVPQQVVLDYDLGTLAVEPQSFNAAVRQLTTSCRRLSDAKGLIT